MSNSRTLYSSFCSSWPSLKLSNFFPALKTTAQESICLLFWRISHTLMHLLFLLVSFPSLDYLNPAWPSERWFQVSLPLCSCPQWPGVSELLLSLSTASAIQVPTQLCLLVHCPFIRCLTTVSPVRMPAPFLKEQLCHISQYSLSCLHPWE